MALLSLEVFEGPTEQGSDTVVTDIGAIEDAKLAAYEQGYTAGWDDASASQADDQSRIKADLARTLQTLGFTFHEARVHVLNAIEPLLLDMVRTVLPATARAALPSIVLETLMPLAGEMADAPVTLVLNPAVRPAIEALLEQATGLPITVCEEPTLSEGQVYLRLGETETRIDLDRATADIARAVRGFFGHPEGN